MTNLQGKTIIITGASRGIGRAIALRCAQDKANIVIAAKSATPHPKLPGTIYTVASEVEALGAKVLPLQVDVRSEEEVEKMVEETVKKFGGVDALVNNAGAIFLADTPSTPMKRFDLMHGVNVRAVYLCSQKALPHLKKGKNPHILNLSPPLSLDPKWLKNHLAYSLSKYGMSLCTLGMSAEFEPYGIAVNSLWPRTLIATAAVDWLMGEAGIKQSRKPEIMADAAHEILCKENRQVTGQTLIDEDVLRQAGMKNFDQYAHEPGETLMPDLYVE
ncbi:MAG: NAD(P)-dependent oxidoreductase [Deltaproteobacteria bacterium]|nr:NAD(P)-dependent oxidoreductase [Deltaproteobacteria bacterium]